MDVDSLLTLFYKYGYYSKDLEPYIYYNGNDVGICYKFRDNFYGELSRVYFPTDLSDAEVFLKKYYWYNNNSKKYGVHLCLDDYKVMNPIIKFVIDDRELSYDDMIELEKTNILPTKDFMYLDKIKRTAYILVDILNLKIVTQQDTYDNLYKISKEYYRLLQELEDNISLYDKNYSKKIIDELAKEEKKDYSKKIDKIKNSIASIGDTKEIERLIKKLLDKLKETEQNESFIANKYELIVMPLKIDIVSNKIALIQDLLNNKKIFSKKEDLSAAFKVIEEGSPLQKIVSYDVFLNNEIKRIDEKYSMIPELDLRTTADFFVDFDNLNINVPKMIGAKKEMQCEDVINDLERKYDIRSREEKNVLLFYHSVFYKVKNYLKFVNQPSVLETINELFDVLKNDNNVLFKIQYLNYLDVYNIEGFINSLKNSFLAINNLEKDKLLGPINVFFRGSRDLNNLDYLLSSSKASAAPSQYNGDNDINYIASVDEGVPVLFVPVELAIDYNNDDSFVILNNKPLLIFDNKDFVLKKEKSDIIRVTRFDMSFDNKNNYRVVNGLRNRKVDLYQNIRIERKSVWKRKSFY